MFILPETDIAKLLVHAARRHGGAEAAVVKPGQVRRTLGRSLRVPEARAEHRAPDHGSPVGREDHVRQAGPGVDGMHGVAEPDEGLPQLPPLVHGEIGIDRYIGVHPWIDDVLDREVPGRAHQVGPGARGAAPGRACPGRAIRPRHPAP
jgi:hypothetical protein